MKLSTLEIKGFKSFGDKVTIHFDEGITAIVGPNGCGKSNVVDAIRWVLGEQSTRMLRSEKMENIIFNGTRNRKPSNLAEVSLSFDNTKNVLPTEYSSVTITRKLYRSGESEYRLNDVQCRLKDITDLFLDTGIGADSYSIIELKMVDEILNNKDNSRRNLFEEAAGISKYKIRKKQTFSKLRDTETDLSRVEDLLFEIEKNLKILESQAKKTERYYKLKEQYKELSSKLAAFRVHGLKRSLEELEKQEQGQQDERLQFQAVIDQLEARLQQEKLESLTQEKNLSIQQKASNDHINKIRQYESDKKLKNEKLNFLREKEIRLSSETEADKRLYDNLGESIIQLEKQKEEEDIKLREIEAKLSNAKNELDNLKSIHQNNKKELDDFIFQEKQLQDQCYKIEKESDILNIQKESLKQELERTSTDASVKQEELNVFSKAILKLEAVLREHETRFETLNKQEEELNLEADKTEKHLQELKDTLVNEHRSLDARQNEYNLTKSLVDNLEGFPESIKFLKKNASWAKNAPLLSDVLFCREEYRIAIENYLEPYMNYYVVDDFREAVQAVNLLSDSAKGRANFFILNAIPKEEKPVKKPSAANCVPALEIIEVDERYRNLCSYLLKDVHIILKDEDEQLDKTDPNATFLSRSGKFSRTKFTLSGGSVGLFEGKRIGRAKNLDVLANEIKKHENNILKGKQQIDEIQGRLQKLKESSQKGVIDQVRGEISRTQAEYHSLKAKQEQYQAFISSNNTRTEDLKQKITRYTAELEQLGPKLSELKTTREMLMARLSALQEGFVLLSEQLNEKSSVYNQENIVFHQQQNKVSGLQKDLEYKTGQHHNLDGRIRLHSAELEKVSAEILELLKNSGDTDTDLISMYEEKTAMEKAVQEAEEEYYKTRGRITEIEGQIQDTRRRKEQAEMLFNTIKDRKNELRMEMNSITERLSVEFSIDISSLPEIMPEELPSEDELKEKTARTRDHLENFGAINPLAVEAYQEMNERYRFINEQRADLIKAKESLMQTIGEIDETAKEQFLQAFTLIRENFIRVFRSLFNEEDSCDIYLVNPDDPLESDIDILAKPKGKRPLTINQLSGGEKTLTATAILFSLYLLKPAPFCIFDEVDAPLDDTNIDKFNNIIRKFSADSQFIIVTHNKRTIAGTDIIYGVTMVEQGISRVVPVDLRNLEPAA